MTKEEFWKLPDDKKRFLVSESLANLIMVKDLAPRLSILLFKSDNLEVMKIVLGAYMNGEIN